MTADVQSFVQKAQSKSLYIRKFSVSLQTKGRLLFPWEGDGKLVCDQRFTSHSDYWRTCRRNKSKCRAGADPRDYFNNILVAIAVIKHPNISRGKQNPKTYQYNPNSFAPGERRGAMNHTWQHHFLLLSCLLIWVCGLEAAALRGIKHIMTDLLSGFAA